MNPPAPPASPEASAAPTEEARSGSRATFLPSIKSGLAAFAIVALVGQAVPALMDVFGGGLALVTALKLGWFYELAFHRVGIDITTASGSTSRLSIAFLPGTGLALWLLYRAGGGVAGRSGSALRDRMFGVTVIALAYALPIAVITTFVRLRLDPGVAFLPGSVHLQGVVWQAFVFPALLGIAAAGAGALVAAMPGGSRPRACLIGGWRMLLGALGLAAIAVLMLAAIRPQGLATYTRAVSTGGSRVAMLLLGHHALLLPTQSFFVLAPSMGGCTSLRGPVGSLPLLCPRTLPVLNAPAILDDIAGVRGRGLPFLPLATRPMPSGYLAFLLVPLLATIAGGRWVAAHATGVRARLQLAVGAGVVFAALVGVGTWMATVGVVTGRASFALGARPLPTALLALAWGVIGGSLGAWSVGMRQDEGTPDPGEPDDPAPPSPTSV